MPQQAMIPPTVIPIGERAQKLGAIPAAVSCCLGFVALLSAFAGAVSGGPGTAIIAGVIGIVFLVFGVGILVVVLPRSKQRVVIDPAGIRLEGTNGRDWQFAWVEIGAVITSTATKVTGTTLMIRSTLVRVEFIPIDHQRLAVDHPHLQPYFGFQNDYGAYRVPLGPGKDLLHTVDTSLRVFGQQRYRGVVDEGIALGFRYS